VAGAWWGWGEGVAWRSWVLLRPAGGGCGRHLNEPRLPKGGDPRPQPPTPQAGKQSAPPTCASEVTEFPELRRREGASVPREMPLRTMGWGTAGRKGEVTILPRWRLP
jgi:hypothetical protein